MAGDYALLERFFEISAPWVVKDALVDEPLRRIDVWVGKVRPRSWFFREGTTRPSADDLIWQHANYGPFQCYVHVQPSLRGELDHQPWAGQDKLPCTRARARQIVAMLSAGVGYDVICNLLQVSFDDLWRIKFNLENGLSGLEPPIPASSKDSSALPVARTAPAGAAAAISKVPDLSDPCWLDLVEGRLDIRIRTLSLQLMLTRIRAQMAVIQDSEVKVMKLRELHRFIIKNERILGYELAQLGRS